MKEFSIPIKITLNCSLSVEANNQDEAYEVADDTMYWAYQNGAPEQHKDLSILDCEIALCKMCKYSTLKKEAKNGNELLC